MGGKELLLVTTPFLTPLCGQEVALGPASILPLGLVLCPQSWLVRRLCPSRRPAGLGRGSFFPRVVRSSVVFRPFLLTSWRSHLLMVPLQARLRFPIDYPYSPPAFRFLTKMWHPNIYEVGPLAQPGGSGTVSGHVCLYWDGTGCKCQPLALDTQCLWR